MNSLIEQRQTLLETLLILNHEMISAVGPDKVLQAILEATLRLFQVEGCSLGLLDKDSDELAFSVMAGKAKINKFRIPRDKGISGWVASTGKGVFSNNVEKDSRFFNVIDKQAGFKTQTLLCAPIRRKGEVMGVIQVLNTTSLTGFTRKDLDLLETLGGMAFTALAHTKTYSMISNANAADRELMAKQYCLVGGTSPAMKKTLQVAKKVATSGATVLLLSESGTGKEVAARAIHRWSPRVKHPFIAINCVALTPELLASELFGHEKGAFTGATGTKKGKFEQADGGTVFLDEIGDLAPDLQAKLLRFLQEKEFQRVGGHRDIRVDVRIIAATNRDLQAAIAEGQFREDLFYRLNVVTLNFPPLRERGEDLPLLVHHFVENFCREVNRPVMALRPEAMAALKNYHWPGNVRELKNVIERAVVLSTGSEITSDLIPVEIRGGTLPLDRDRVETVRNLPLAEAVESFKRETIRRALQQCGGNQSLAAQALGVQSSNLSRLIKRLNI